MVDGAATHLESDATHAIPRRRFGRHPVTVSALGLGGHHLGDAPDDRTAIAMVRRALDGGVTFFDNCWEYHRGKSEVWMGLGLADRRDEAFLMTKVCTHGRDGALATRMLEQSLRRLRTDHLDLWQVHGVCFDNDPELFMRTGGAAEALLAAQRAGKVRFVGFSGHKHPTIHLAMLATGFPFDAVQMPLNVFDGSFRSFASTVVPEATRRGLAVLGMKPLSGRGEPITHGVVSAEEALRYAMSLPVTTTITGMDRPEVVEQNLRIAQHFVPMRAPEMEALRKRVHAHAGDGRYELYKVSLKYDNPEARMAHDFPIDPKQREVAEMLRETENSGHPFPKLE